jgi:Zn-dependent protease
VSLETMRAAGVSASEIANVTKPPEGRGLSATAEAARRCRLAVLSADVERGARAQPARYPPPTMFSTGYWTLGRVRGAPVRVHWSAPFGAIAFTGFAFSPGLWAGFFLLVILHELGHAALVQRFGYEVVAVRVHAFGGDCQWSGDPTGAEVAAVAWGGVLVQAVLWVAATVALAILGPPSTPVVAALAFTFTSTNARVIVFNLLPIPPLDGHRAWQLLPMWWQARQEQRAYLRDRAARQREKGRDVARAQARKAAEKELTAFDVADEDLAPMPPEVKAVLDRVMRGEGAKKEREGD